VCRELQRPRWLAMESELLRQAARVAQRPRPDSKSAAWDCGREVC
jgi:hypothetical protein